MLYCLKAEGGLGFGKVVDKNTELVGNVLQLFPNEFDSIWHRVIKSKYGLQQNGWDAATRATRYFTSVHFILPFNEV